MNILYIAYSCTPNKGSEEKIGWNIVTENAKTNSVFVVTKEEHRKNIEQYLLDHPIENIKFYYVDIPKIYKLIFKGIAYSIRLNIWLKKSFATVEQICKEEKIDIIHQITPVEFRSIGDYYKIPNTRFVCGPLGGGEFIPKGLEPYAKGNNLVEYLRLILNSWAKIKYKVNRKFQHCNYVFFANDETRQYLLNLLDKTKHSILSDTGISESDIETQSRNFIKNEEKIIFLVAGRLAYRKGHRLLLDALSQLPENIDYQCRIVGNGPEEERLKQLVKKYKLDDKVVFTGRIPFSDTIEEYNNADVFIMPSIRETTGSVLLEAMSKGLPVITLNHFGGKVLLNDETAWLLDGNTKEEYIEALKCAIVQCCTESSEVIRKSENARQKATQHTWGNKVAFYNSIYKEIVE